MEEVRIIDNEDDLAWIEKAGTDEEKEARRNIILHAIDINGYEFEPGVAKSFIPRAAYYQKVEIPGIGDHATKAIEIALNWNALGADHGALAGAGVRWGLRDSFRNNRETNVIRELNEDHMKILNDYMLDNAEQGEVVSFWEANANNILGLAGAIFNRELHHWNSNNTKPQQALLGALNQENIFNARHYRALFYLSIHPVPLSTMEALRADIAAGKVPGITDAVAVRCRSAPAGTGDIAACSSAATSLLAEPFASKLGDKYVERIEAVRDLNKEIVENAGAYHPFATAYGSERTIVDKSEHRAAMIALAGYIKAVVKGTLGESNALEKFSDTHARQIRLWTAAFKTEVEGMGTDLSSLAAD